MNFNKRTEILDILYDRHGEVFMSDDSDARTSELKRISSLIDEFKNLTKDTLNEAPELSPHDDFGDLFTAEEWMSEGMRGCAFVPSDGSGYWATKDGHSYSHYDIFGHKPEWATHVAWYNC